MSIEFSCPQCGNLLRTGEDKAGLRAKCPECGNPVRVPYPGAAAAGSEDEVSADDAFDMDFDREEPADEFSQNFGGSRPAPSRDRRECPMCGESIAVEARKCRFCGEELAAAGPARDDTGGPTRIDASDVVATAWAIYKDNMGLVIGAVLLVGIISVIVSLVAQFVALAMLQAAAGAEFVLAVGVSMVVQLGINAWLWCGQNLLLVKIAKGEPAEIGDLFAGGPYVLRMIGLNIVFVLLLYLGLAACFIPGILVLLIFWPFGYVLVDKNPPGLQSLSQANRLTDKNWGAAFVLFLAAVAFNILGAIALLVGLIVSIPFTSFIFAVAYVKMSGQPAANDV